MSELVRQPIFASGDYEVDLGRRELRSGGVPVPIGSRAFELVEVLVRSAGDLITKNDLMDRVWPGTIVNDNTLQVHIAAVRKALGARRSTLKTESGRGYRLLGDWTIRHDGATVAPAIPGPSPAPGERQTTNFPVAVTALVGRAAAAERLRALVSAYRIVTLTGPGGIGKTTLALQVARDLLDDFDDGGWLVELAALRDADLVPAAVAGVLGLKFGREAISAEAVARALGDAELLLVLDTCEHLMGAVAELAEMAVRFCPGVTVLATSREVLRIDGEYVYRVPPLDVPPVAEDGAEDLLAHSAVALFIARLKALHPEFSVAPANLPTIAEICRRLDGIPLAIEFAAARAATLSVAQVALGLEDRFGLLTSGRRTALPRHRTLRAALDWSYELLSPAEREALCRLSVFAGWFPLEAAVAVASSDDVDEPESIGTIANLVAKSLVSIDNRGPMVRYRLLDTTRAYASAKLAEYGNADKAARYHAKFFHDVLNRTETAATMAAAEEGFAAYADRLPDVRVALEWSFSSRGDGTIAIGLAAAAAQYFLELSLLAECLRWTEQALGSLDGAWIGSRAEMELRAAHGLSLMFTVGNTEEVGTALARALELAESLNDAPRQLLMLRGMHIYLTRIGDQRGATEVGERCQALAKSLDDPSSSIMAAWMIGVAQHLEGDQAIGVAYCESARTQASDYRRGHLAHMGFDDRNIALIALARALWLRGYPDRAVEGARFAIKEAEALQHPVTLCITMIWTVYVFLWIGDWPSAEEIIERLVALAMRYSLGPYRSVAFGLKGQALVGRGDMSDGIPLLRQHLATLRQARHQVLTTVFATALAEALLRTGDANEALETIDQALAQIGTAKTFDLPEIYRVKGTILASSARSDPAEAERSLRRALEIAREQSALGWELRAAMDLARLWRNAGRIGEAHDLLAPIYVRFTQGFASADLQAAASLLAELAQ
jgi:predicted ATPase/DNA-binding winged helix-turn-helix (wHTH) protein